MLTLLEALKHIRDNGPRHTSVGICGNLFNDELEDEFTELAKCWPRYSGLIAYPVPHPTLPAGDAYLDTLDKWADTYGDNRRELLQWAIKELENDTA